MQPIGNLLGQDRLKELAKHPMNKNRDEFFTRINSSRVSFGIEPITYARLGKELKEFEKAGINRDALLKECSQNHSFTRLFYGKLKKIREAKKLDKRTIHSSCK